MAEYSVIVTDAENEALARIAARDGISVGELVARQMTYYLRCVIGDFVDQEVALDAEQKAELNAALAIARDDFLKRSVAAVK